MHLTGETLPAITMTIPQDIPALAYPLLAVLGGISALIGVALMKSAAYAEQIFAVCIKPLWLRPMVGGLLVGGLAIISPTVLSSGHIAMRAGLVSPPLLWAALGLLLLKRPPLPSQSGRGSGGGCFLPRFIWGC